MSVICFRVNVVLGLALMDPAIDLDEFAVFVLVDRRSPPKEHVSE